MEDFTPEIARKLGMSKVTGVVVTQVEPASFGEDIDFARGDVITEMNHAPISSMADYRAQVAKLKPGDDVLFRVARHGENDRVLMLFLAGSVPSTK